MATSINTNETLPSLVTDEVKQNVLRGRLDLHKSSELLWVEGLGELGIERIDFDDMFFKLFLFCQRVEYFGLQKILDHFRLKIGHHRGERNDTEVFTFINYLVDLDVIALSDGTDEDIDFNKLVDQSSISPTVMIRLEDSFLESYGLERLVDVTGTPAPARALSPEL